MGQSQSKEPLLNDAELRAVRSILKWGSSKVVTKKTMQDMEALCLAAVSEPTTESEPEIVVEIVKPGTAVIRRSSQYWGDGKWIDTRWGYSIEDAEHIAFSLRAREKVEKRPKIEVVKRPDGNWDVVSSHYEWHPLKSWIISTSPQYGWFFSECEARNISAKLEAEGNYPSVVKVKK